VSSLISEEEDKIFYRNLGTYLSYFTAQYSRKLFFKIIFVQIFAFWEQRIKILAHKIPPMCSQQIALNAAQCNMQFGGIN
jgi:hypothetical protein